MTVIDQQIKIQGKVFIASEECFGTSITMAYPFCEIHYNIANLMGRKIKRRIETHFFTQN